MVTDLISLARIAAAKVAPPQDVDDVAQETYLRLHGREDRINGSYVYLTARAIVTNNQRKTQVQASAKPDLTERETTRRRAAYGVPNRLTLQDLRDKLGPDDYNLIRRYAELRGTCDTFAVLAGEFGTSRGIMFRRIQSLKAKARRVL